MKRALLIALLLAGCVAKSPPNAAPPPPPAATGPFVGAADTSPLPGEWWRLYGDAALNEHVARALVANRDIRVAVANLDAARANSRLAGAARTPDVVLESGASPTTRGANQPSTTGVPKSSYELGAEAVWEADLFGRLRNQSSAASADAEAVAAARDGVQLAVVADVVGAWLDLCWADELARVATRQITTQRALAETVSRQVKVGEVSPLELAQVRQLLGRLEAGLPAFEADAQRARYLLANREALPPAEAAQFRCERWPMLPAALPVGDGAALIARRPDIREAERRLAAAGARVKVATAEMYPRVTLGASGGLIGGSLDAFITPLISWSFMNPARIKARISLAEADQQGALAQYDAAWLRALREVETALADTDAERRANQSLTTAVVEAQAAASRAEARVRLGDANPLIALDARRTAYETELLAMLSARRVAQRQVFLFRSLGGGWEDAPSWR
jgi:NodT family efflux transporter outer membrane factor (OMF) lipoprotein